MPDFVSDEDVVKAMMYLRVLCLTVHIRGTDERPVVEFRNRGTRTVVGGSELKRRFEWLNNDS